tara:strand:- start:278 stop:451 length:174 start_codon:yes stop_codon:yes gene_type:complete
LNGENETWDEREKWVASCYFSTSMPKLPGLFRLPRYLWTKELALPEPGSVLKGLSLK